MSYLRKDIDKDRTDGKRGRRRTQLLDDLRKREDSGEISLEVYMDQSKERLRNE
jgi:hypothetical protein